MEKVFYICLIVTFGIFIFSLIMYARIQKHRYFLCPHCGYKYKPGGFSAFFARKYNVTQRLLTCPMCSQRNYMENYEDGEGPKKDTDAE